jgi:O-antigen/teichoic acid export membrane protein
MLDLSDLIRLSSAATVFGTAMPNIRRALALTTIDRYVMLVLNFGTIAIVSRLLTPDEIGFSYIGTAITGLVLVVREFATANFLIQKPDLSVEDVKTSFTVLLAVSLIMVVGLMVSAPWIASIYNEPALATYLQIASIAMLCEAFSGQVVALLKRDLAFGRTLRINVAITVTQATTTIALAALGYSYMSFAWAWLISAAVGVVLCVIYRPAFGSWSFSLEKWRDVLAFGIYNGLGTFVVRIYESTPYLLLGRLISPNAVGILGRAQNVCMVPEKMFLGGLLSLAFPAFSAQVREGRDLKPMFLHAVTLITGVQWPALVTLALLASPAVQILLGSQWTSAVPIVQIIALSFLFAFYADFPSALLNSLGQFRENLWRAAIAYPVSALIMMCAAYFGLYAIAFSMFIVMPLQSYVAVHFLRKHIRFSWADLWNAVRQSALVSLTTALGPLAVAAMLGWRFDFGVIATICAIAGAGIGWLTGLWLSDHPLLPELKRFAGYLQAKIADVAARQAPKES